MPRVTSVMCHVSI